MHTCETKRKKMQASAHDIQMYLYLYIYLFFSTLNLKDFKLILDRFYVDLTTFFGYALVLTTMSNQGQYRRKGIPTTQQPQS